MLKSLYIKNFVLVDEIKVVFDSGLNIITGETGAGKSIIVNAIGQLCGERASTDLVRTGAKKAVIEAEINVKSIHNINKLINELDIEFDHSQPFIIRKELNASGASRIFINDSPINLSRLNFFSSMVFDFHGQHQHQRLLDQNNHIAYLDSYCRIDKSLIIYREQYDSYMKAGRERDELISKQHKAFQMQDMYRYQNEELTKAELKDNELDELKQELKILSNVENLHQFGRALTDTLYNGETNAGDLLSQAETDLITLSEMDTQFGTFIQNLQEARSIVEEIGSFTEKYLDSLEFDPQRIEFIHQRIASLEFLLKKYQKTTIADLIELHTEIGQMLGDMEQFDEAIRQKEKEIQTLQDELILAGERLSQIRKDGAQQFEKTITEIMHHIGMNDARFQVTQSNVENADSQLVLNGKHINPGKNGFDEIVFEVSSNAGEDFYPLQKIASGGEISRIMLAIKSVLAETDQTPVLIFDEIDSGISGRVAQIVGKNLCELASYHQIICVTHLPQIAAFAGSHYKVSKMVQDRRTLVEISLLNSEQQIQEIAHLLGGIDISDHALQNARHLLAESKKN
ncbi:MAG: DNA repair protein RecN [Calditrichaceae bacterium]|nr:DNA repair protein RecN [Calditrichaceae bacterium]